MPNGPGSADRSWGARVAVAAMVVAGALLSALGTTRADASGNETAMAAEAGRQLAQTYLDGRSLKNAPPFIIQRYRERAEAGAARAQFFLGLMYEQGLIGEEADLAAARRWFDAAAAQGHAPAQYKAGAMALAGRGGPPDVVRAASLFASAAQAGLKEAQFNYALLLSQGRGVPRDVDAAVRWFERAALAGMARAAMSLAEIHTAGVGRPPDPIEAWAWLRRAESLGASEAAELRAKLEERMDAEQLAEARKLKEAHDALAGIRAERQ